MEPNALRAPTAWNRLHRVEASEEIRRIVHRWTKSIAEGDAASVLERLSEHDGTLIIGTDLAEWWHGQEAHAVWRQQIEELGTFPVTAVEIEAWEEGSVGWASVKETIAWEGEELEARGTYVLHLERGEWKVVQVHWSFPKANVEAPGSSAHRQSRGTREDNPTRTARPLFDTLRRWHCDDCLHRHRRLDSHARTAG
jgi:ketosteroid isomerase-like protein